MEMQAIGKVTGFKCWKNDEDKIDSGTIFVEASLKHSSLASYGKNGEGLAKGYASMEYKTRGSELIRRLAKLECPFTANLVIEQETDGKGIRCRLLRCRNKHNGFKPASINLQ